MSSVRVLRLGSRSRDAVWRRLQMKGFLSADSSVTHPIAAIGQLLRRSEPAAIAVTVSLVPRLIMGFRSGDTNGWREGVERRMMRMGRSGESRLVKERGGNGRRKVESEGLVTARHVQTCRSRRFVNLHLHPHLHNGCR